MASPERTMLGYAVGEGKGRPVAAVVFKSASALLMHDAAGELGLDVAVNLDGGGSTQMQGSGTWSVMTGRSVPVYVVFINPECVKGRDAW